ncbi:MAG: redoxin domain-containing protein [Rhodospirillaceae bacterium]|jgi:peroxiredoxin
MTLPKAVKTLIPAAALVIAATTAQPVLASPKLGAPAPAFTGVDSNGKSVSLNDYLGKTVVLEWTNHDCPYVVRHYGTGNMQKLQKETTAQGIVWLSVISSAPGTQGHVYGKEANDLTASRKAAPTKVILDPKGEIGRKYSARTTPHMYIVNPTGELVYKGGIDDKPTSWGKIDPDTKNYVRLALADLKAGKKVSKASTRPYGCSVKYAY